MKTIIEYWDVILVVCIMGGALGCAFYRFIFEPRYEQIEQVKEWLKYAVTMAEKSFGEKSGQLKLRYVYDLFVDRFPWVARVITFDQFDGYVEEALKWLNTQLESNAKIQEIVNENK